MSDSNVSYPLERSGTSWLIGHEAYFKAFQEGEFPTFSDVLSGLVKRGHPTVDSPEIQPWLTLVLGPGCLDIPAEPEVSAPALETAVEEELLTRVLEWPPGTESLVSMAKAFTRTLADDRLPERRTTATPSKADPFTVEPVAASLALVTALLTRFYHAARAEVPSATGRWEQDVAIYSARRAAWQTRDFDAMLLAPAVAEINHITNMSFNDSKASPDVRNATTLLLTEIKTALNMDDRSGDRRLRVVDLRLLTEVTWHLLTLGSSVYPGWTELLLSLMLRNSDGARPRRPRPRYRHLSAQMPASVSDILRPATEESWRLMATGAGRDTDRGRLYASAADVLWAQAGLIERYKDKRSGQDPCSLPPAVVYVTSLDLEIEMALWLKAAGRQFSMAVPFHLVRHNPLRAELCWLMGDVHPKNDGNDEDSTKLLGQVKRPDNWRVLTSEFDVDELRLGPIIVHLNGCPLIDIPDLDSGGPLSAALASSDDGRRLPTLQHAVTIDEYLALRLAEAEALSAAGLADVTLGGENMGKNDRRGLPRAFVADSDNNRRVFMILGVPIADPAVRSRVAAQLAARRIRLSAGAESTFADKPAGTASADITGFAVNRHVDDDEVGLLNWLGLDVVEDGCDAFTDDLAAHALDLGLRPSNLKPRQGSTNVAPANQTTVAKKRPKLG